jgi:hypothetical protein
MRSRLPPVARGTNTARRVPAGAGITLLANHAEALRGLEELDPRLREIIHRAPMSLSVADVLRAQQEFGVERAAAELTAFLRITFPGWRPIEEEPGYARAARPLAGRKRRAPGEY